MRRTAADRPRAAPTRRRPGPPPGPVTTDRPAAPAEPGAPAEPLALAERHAIREAFFRQARVDPRQFLQAFDHLPGFDYFVKDDRGRTMLNTRKLATRGPAGPDERVVGLTVGEYLAKSLADHYEADDRRVLRTGQPVRNIVEIRLDELGVPDWIITDKYPLRDADGRVVGILGTIQSLDGRIRALPHLGVVGVAAHFVRENLGRGLPLDDVAAHVGVSKRHLQRLFRQAIGMSIQQFVIRSRVHTAAHQLARGTRPLAEIAIDCGFSDQSAFTNTFRRIVGVAPRAYRKASLRDATP